MASWEHYLYLSSLESKFTINFPKAYDLHEGQWYVGLTDFSCKLSDKNTRNIFIYTDICIQSYCLGELRNCLRRIGVNQKGTEVNCSFDRIHYFPVSRSTFNSINLYISDENSEVVSLASYPLECTLHFLRKS